jgi:hypothetical protein
MTLPALKRTGFRSIAPHLGKWPSHCKNEIIPFRFAEIAIKKSIHVWYNWRQRLAAFPCDAESIIRFTRRLAALGCASGALTMLALKWI